MVQLKSLQTGTVAFQETHFEWHNKIYRDEFQKLLVKAFGAAGWITAQQKTSLKRRLSNQVERQVQRW
jgi:hypothetical protein